VASGASSSRTLFLHVVPNGIYPVVANTTLQMGSAVLIEAGLSFLGLGDPNTLSWGRLVYQGRDYMATAWWIAFFSGLAITLLTLAFNLLGDELNYLFNPRMRQVE
jgi:peptide/nickel transport system permease protein